MNHRARLAVLAALLLPFCLPGLSCLAPAEAAASAAGARPRPAPAPRRDGRLEERVERVAIFKDGYGLFTRRAKATVAADGTVYTTAIPEGAVLGSFWATAKKAELKAMRAEQFEAETREREDAPCVDTAELVRRNPGREVVLQLADEELRGKLAGLLERPAAPGGEGELAGVHVPGEPMRGGGLLLLEQDGGEQLVLPLSEVRRIRGKGLSTRCTLERRERVAEKRLVFDFGEQAAGKEIELSIMYFAPGIRWIPTYRLELEGEERGDLALQAELLNEVESLAGTRIDLVVGVPNFRFKSVASPLTLERALRDVLGRTAPGLMGMGNDLSNALFSQRASEHRVADASGGGDYAGPDLPPDAPQDLEVYHLAPLSLPKGARMSVPLWERSLSLTHLHTLDLSLDAARGARSRGPLQLSRNEIWHQLELTNPGGQAWTTGPVLVMRDGIPVAQELLTYTPKGGRTLLPLTVAVNLRASLEEEETYRASKAEAHLGRSWYRVKRKGELKLDSLLGRNATLRVRLETEGKVTGAEGARVKLSDGSGPNNRSEVIWEVKLGKGKSRVLEFSSEAFVG
ncbi:MAG: hypothetical protein P1V51_15550 [Deltaproteobacteria bacterium]|nr:hypothetical protein [Deltaproteobacteria bacterium]